VILRAAIVLVATLSAAVLGNAAPAPAGVRLDYSDYGTGGGALALDVDRTVRTRAEDLPMVGSVQRRRMSGRFSVRRLGAGPERTRISLVLDRFSLRAWRADNELEPVGEDAMEALELKVDLDGQGPSGPVVADPRAVRDATTWSSAEPLVEVVRQVVGLGLPRLSADRVEPGAAWSFVGLAPAGLDGAPGIEMEVYHFYFYLAQVDCGLARCARIAEVLHISSFERRLFGDSMISVDLQGVGQAVHEVRLGSQGPWRVQGELSLEARLSSHPAPGLPPSYTTSSQIETSYRLSSIEE